MRSYWDYVPTSIASIFWTSATNTNAVAVEIKSVKFNPGNEVHQSFLKHKIADFIAKRDQLISLDMKLGVPVGVTALWMLGITGSLGGYLSLASIAYACFSAPADLRRDRVQGEFTKALDELFALYHWCAADQQCRITYDSQFIALVQAILPFTRDAKKLLAWDAKAQVQYLWKDEDPTSNKWFNLFYTTKANASRTLYGAQVAIEESKVPSLTSK